MIVLEQTCVWIWSFCYENGAGCDFINYNENTVLRLHKTAQLNSHVSLSSVEKFLFYLRGA